MATAGNDAFHRYVLKTSQQRAGIYWIRFETNGTSNPDGQVGNTREITVTRLSSGTYKLSLAHQWARVVIIACHTVEDVDSTGIVLSPEASVEGYGQDNSVTVQNLDEALGNAGDTTDQTCEVVLMLSGSPGDA